MVFKLKIVPEISSALKTDISWSSLVLFAAGLIVSYILILVPVYNVFFHPLHKYPGPKLWAASALPWGFSWMSGNWHHKVMELHNKYGRIIRVGPNELSYDVPEAWEDVYGRHKQGHRKENPKPTWYLSPKHNDIVGAKQGDHGRMRRLLANGFTSAAMLEQEPLIKGHVDLFMQRLREKSDNGKTTVDIFHWLAYCTFDIIGDLSFGEPFGCLRESMMHPWIGWVFANIKLTHTLVLCKRIAFFYLFLPILETWKLYKGSIYYESHIHEVIDRRLTLETERPDFVQIMRSKKGALYLTQDEIYSNAALLTLGGSETTSNSMAVVVYMIITHPHVKAKLTKELLSTFTSEDEIDMRSAANMTYLMAVIEESMRYHPPGPNAMWRMTPPGGNSILGDRIPGNTVLGVPHRVMYRSEHNFKRANEFIPERWTGNEKDSEFANDRRDSFHPFSYGPRTCLAMNLAYAEMRYIIARLMWNFDIEIAEQSRQWTDGLRAWLIWEKRPLHVYLKPRAHGRVQWQEGC